jgi:hypothetical protein
VVLEKCGEGGFDRLCESEEMLQSRRGEEYLHTVKRKKDNWIGYIWLGNCLLTQDTGKDRNDGKKRKKT